MWSQISGPTVALLGSTTNAPAFIAPDDGFYTFALVVNDGASDSDPDTVDVAVTNIAPRITTITASPDTLSESGGQSSITVLASDPGDQTNLTYLFDCDGDGGIDAGPQSARSHTCAYSVLNRGTTTPVNVRVEDGDGGSDSGCTPVTVSPVQGTWSLELEIRPDTDDVTGLENLLLGVAGGCGNAAGYTAPAILPFLSGIKTFHAYLCHPPGNQTDCDGVASDSRLSTSVRLPSEVQQWVVEITFFPPGASLETSRYASVGNGARCLRTQRCALWTPRGFSLCLLRIPPPTP